jgi:hypothetical protein
MPVWGVVCALFLLVSVFFTGFGLGRDYQMRRDDAQVQDEFLREQDERENEERHQEKETIRLRPQRQGELRKNVALKLDAKPRARY